MGSLGFSINLCEKPTVQKTATTTDPLPTPFSISSRSQKPGALQGEVWLTVQTGRAQHFIYGRRKSNSKPAIWGLITFADRVKTLWRAASHDDPYADWWLVKMDEAMQACRECIQRCQQALTTLLDGQCALQVSTAQSVKPQRISLSFSNPYAFRGAQLLAEYDRLMCLQMTVAHIGIPIEPELERNLMTSSKKMRAVFSVPQGFRDLGVTRFSFVENEEKNQQAKALMGAVPEEIINGVITSSLHPKKRVNTPQKQSAPNNSGSPDERMDDVASLEPDTDDAPLHADHDE